MVSPPSHTRRAVLHAAGIAFAGAVAGCAGASDTDATSDTPVFENLSVADAPTRCRVPDYASHAVTPVPYMTPQKPPDQTAAIEFATSFERAYLDNWVVLNYDPLPRATATPETPTASSGEYPAVTVTYEERSVVQTTADGVVVRFQYERFVAGDSVGRYTVTYYLTADAVVRAETEGYTTPGPHPTKEGVEIEC